MSFNTLKAVGKPVTKRLFKNLIQYFPNLFEHGISISETTLEGVNSIPGSSAYWEISLHNVVFKKLYGNLYGKIK